MPVLPPLAATSTRGYSGVRYEIRPQSSPMHDCARRLSRSELLFLVTVLNRHVGYVGLDQEEGTRAAELRDKLLAIHAHGFEH